MRVENKTYFVILGENLKSIRKEKGLSQQELANRCNVDRAKISDIESAKEDFFFETLIELSRGLQVELKYLITF